MGTGAKRRGERAKVQRKAKPRANPAGRPCSLARRRARTRRRHRRRRHRQVVDLPQQHLQVQASPQQKVAAPRAQQVRGARQLLGLRLKALPTVPLPRERPQKPMVLQQAVPPHRPLQTLRRLGMARRLPARLPQVEAHHQELELRLGRHPLGTTVPQGHRHQPVLLRGRRRQAATTRHRHGGTRPTPCRSTAPTVGLQCRTAGRPSTPRGRTTAHRPTAGRRSITPRRECRRTTMDLTTGHPATRRRTATCLADLGARHRPATSGSIQGPPTARHRTQPTRGGVRRQKDTGSPLQGRSRRAIRAVAAHRARGVPC